MRPTERVATDRGSPTASCWPTRSRGPVRLLPRSPRSGRTLNSAPGTCELELAIHVMAWRHLAAGCRNVTARLRRKGYVVNRKEVARLLRVWGLLRARPSATRRPRAGPSTSPPRTSCGRPTRQASGAARTAGDRTPAEARAEARPNHNGSLTVSQRGVVTVSDEPPAPTAARWWVSTTSESR